MRPNPTLQRPLTEKDLAERQAWYDEQMAEAAKVNEAAMLAGQQQREAEFQNRLVEATQLSFEQLRGIREWLKHNEGE